MLIDTGISISIPWFNILWKNSIRFLSKTDTPLPESIQDTILKQFAVHFVQCKDEIIKELSMASSNFTTAVFLKFFLVLFNAFLKQTPSAFQLPSFPSFFSSFLEVFDSVKY